MPLRFSGPTLGANLCNEPFMTRDGNGKINEIIQNNWYGFSAN